MADVFISYSHRDLELVVPIIEQIRSLGYSIWWDHRLFGGHEYRTRIEAEISAAGAVIVVWSRSSSESTWVVSEASVARDLKKLVPVRIDDCAIPIDFRTLHVIDLTSWPVENQANFATLEETLAAAITSRAKARAAAQNAPELIPTQDLAGLAEETEANASDTDGGEFSQKIALDRTDWIVDRSGWFAPLLKFMHLELSGLMLPDGKWRSAENVVGIDRKTQTIRWLLKTPPPVRLVASINSRAIRPYSAGAKAKGFSAAMFCVAAALLSIFFFAPHAHEFVVESLRFPVTTPYRVGIIGPTSGRYREFGQGHLRGTISGFQHAIQSQCAIDPGDMARLFKFSVYNEAPFLEKSEKIEDGFPRILHDNDLVFGPVFSQDAVTALTGRQVDIPVVLSIAATTKIREHPQFGDMLFQLANNVDVYSNQLLRYFWQYAEPRPTKLWIFYQDDEYGRSGRAALVGQAAQYGLDVRSRSIQNDLAAGDSYASDQLKAAQALGDAAREADERTLIILVALGRSLRLMVDQIKPKQLQSKVATFTSIDLVALDAGTFDGIYVAYSYFPRTYSVGTLAFLEHTRQATVRAEELLGETSNQDWGDIGTVEAEAHDAAYYWVSTRLIRRLGISCPREGVREYATMFSIIGSGKAQYMNTALLLFQVRGGLMIPVELKK